MVGKSRRRQTELENKAMKKNKRQRSWAKSFIWGNIKILKDEKGETGRMEKQKEEVENKVERQDKGEKR